MADKDTTTEPEQINEGDAFLTFLSKYKTVMLAAILIISGAYLYRVVNSEKTSKGKQAAAAEFALAGENIMMLQALVEEFPNEAITPLARMKLAQAFYKASNYQMASSAYDEFLTAHPDHDLAAAAVLGKAHCTEGGEDVQGALAEYDAFLQNDSYAKHSYLTPQATLGKARCLAASGKLKDARDLYEEFVAGSDESSQWALTAQQAIDDLDTQLERLEPAESDATETP